MIWRVMLYIVATESNENNMLEKKKKTICEPYQKSTFFDMDIFET